MWCFTHSGSALCPVLLFENLFGDYSTAECFVCLLCTTEEFKLFCEDDTFHTNNINKRKEQCKDKAVGLEACSRCNNIPIIGLLESIEGPQPTAFFVPLPSWGNGLHTGKLCSSCKSWDLDCWSQQRVGTNYDCHQWRTLKSIFLQRMRSTNC